MNAHAPARNENVLTDMDTPDDMIFTLMDQLVATGGISSSHPNLTAVWATPEEIWELDNYDLLATARGCGEFNPIASGCVPISLHIEDGSSQEDEECFLATNKDRLALDAAEELVTDEYDGIQDIEGEFLEDGVLDTPLIVVHKNTTQAAGFILLVRAIRARQQEFGLSPVQVFVHEGSGSPQPFEEATVEVRHIEL